MIEEDGSNMPHIRSIEARNKAGEFYKQGFNCAESILLAGRELLAPDWDPRIVKMVTPLGGGIGRVGCFCGALNASIMILGMLKGRTDTATPRFEVGRHAARIHDLFFQEFGSPCCRDLNFSEFDNRAHYVRCLKIVGGTAQLLFEYLANNDLLPERKSEIEEDAKMDSKAFLR
jgi:C_GCAxxG_C_C family probable redox protein